MWWWTCHANRLPNGTYWALSGVTIEHTARLADSIKMHFVLVYTRRCVSYHCQQFSGVGLY